MIHYRTHAQWWHLNPTLERQPYTITSADCLLLPMKKPARRWSERLLVQPMASKLREMIHQRKMHTSVNVQHGVAYRESSQWWHAVRIGRCFLVQRNEDLCRVNRKHVINVPVPTTHDAVPRRYFTSQCICIINHLKAKINLNRI